MSSKNLGQVSGVYVGNTPPTNTILIWYDNTPTQLRHKIYDPALMQWVVLDQSVITSTTYSELVNSAKTAGLSVGQYFVITDKYNALALAITSTKVQYSDNLGNILIDDLGINIQYHVSSSNLQIDDVTGVFDTVNKKLVFAFDEQTASLSADEYILGKSKRNNVWSLVKYKLQSFLSKVAGNSITWNGGFFFSFSEALKSAIDKSGGIVGKDAYDADKEHLTTSINNVAKENQDIIQNAHDELIEATKPSVFYETKLPQSINEDEEAVNVQKGDTLMSIISKIQRWINKFKTATGIRISQDFTDKVTPQYVNNNDTVDSAIRKLQYWIKNISIAGVLPEDWEAKDNYNEIESVKANDSISDALAKLMGLLNQIGEITNAKITSSNARVAPMATVFSEKSTTFDLYDGILKFQNHPYRTPTDDIIELSLDSGLSITASGTERIKITANEGVKIATPSVQLTNGYYSDAAFCNDANFACATFLSGIAQPQSQVSFYAALSALMPRGAISNVIPVYDAYFPRLRAGGLFCGVRAIENNENVYLDDSTSVVRLAPITDSDITMRNVYLPTKIGLGHIIIFDNVLSASNRDTKIFPNGGKIYLDSTETTEILITTATPLMIAVCSIYSDSENKLPIWKFSKLMW